jgi:hypothetical protein
MYEVWRPPTPIGSAAVKDGVCSRPTGESGRCATCFTDHPLMPPTPWVIESGLFRKRILAVPVDDVESLTPNEARVDLRVAGSGGRS